METSVGKNKQMRSSVVFFHILIAIVHLGFDFYQHVSTKMEDISSSLPGRGEKKEGVVWKMTKWAYRASFNAFWQKSLKHLPI